MDEALKQCIIQIDKRLTNIETAQFDISKKLDNHVVHIAADVGVMKTDIDWLKRFMKSGDGQALPSATDSSKESKDDIKTQTDVDWLKRFFFIGITAAVTSVASLIVMLIHIFFNK